MSMFGSILARLGLGNAAASEAAAPVPTPAEAANPVAPSEAQAPISPTPASAPRSAAPSGPESPAAVDVVALLDEMAAANPQTLHWKTSIVDLLKLLGLDSSLDARKDLANELDCPEDLLADSAQMNLWLHKTVLQRLAENGGKIPPELLG